MGPYIKQIWAAPQKYHFEEIGKIVIVSKEFTL